MSSKSLTKLFYRSFYIACLILFVAFPIQSFIPYYGTNDKFWRPFCLFFVFTALVLIIALLVQKLVDQRKKWISALAAIVLFSFTLFSHLPIVLEYGAQTTQVSDFGNALATAQVQSPIKSIHYSIYSNWTLFPKTLAIVQQLFGAGVLTVLVVNTILYALSAVLIYCLVQLSNVNHKEFLGFVAAAFYAAWPSSYLWCLITAPDYWHICILLLALLILGIAIRFTKRWWSKSGLITISALLVVLSDFYKATSRIMIVSIAICLVLYAVNWIQEQAAERKELFTKHIFNALFRKFGAYALLFLLVFSLGQNACFHYQDYYVGWTVNRILPRTVYGWDYTPEAKAPMYQSMRAASPIWFGKMI